MIPGPPHRLAGLCEIKNLYSQTVGRADSP